ncbi:MAG: EamA family transporter [bacterium]|nr:EamA family transporter [bacterium]
MNNLSKKQIFTVLILTQIVISATYMMAKFALREFSPFSLGVYRFLLAGAVFAGLLLWRKKFILPAKEDRKTFLLLAFLAVPLNQGLFLYGMKYTFAAHGALMYATTPIMVLLLSSLFLGERPTVIKITGIALGFIGIILVLFDSGIHLSAKTIKGDLLLIVAVITWAVYTIISKTLLKKYPPLVVTGYALGLGALMFVPFGLPAVIRQDYGQITRNGILSLLYLALMTSVLGYLVWSWGLSKLEATKVSVFSNLQPIVAALLGWAFLSEPITLRFAIGAAVVIAGVFLTEKG